MCFKIKNQIRKLYTHAILGNLSLSGAWVAILAARGFSLVEIGVSPHLYRMMPYIITLLVLAFTSKKSRAPKAEGIPYDKGTR